MNAVPQELQPLSPAQLRDMNGALNELNRLERKLELAEQAGRDCSSERAMMQYLIDRISKIKATYFPDKP